MINILLYPILVPVIIGLLVLVLPKKDFWLKSSLSLIGTAINLGCAILLFGKEASFSTGWCGFGFNFSLRLYHFSSFILLASAGFSILIVLYSFLFMKGREYIKQFYLFLMLTVAMVNGAVLANNLLLLAKFMIFAIINFQNLLKIIHYIFYPAKE